MNKIGIFCEVKEEVEEIKEVEKVLKFACKKENLNQVEFNVILVDQETIQKLNKQYRNIDKPTDVITFALEDETKLIAKSKTRVLGDIYISYDQANIQKDQYGHSLLRELAFLAVHGFYHLLGYDHMTKEEEQIMFQKQEEVLDTYGIKREK